ncbi:hypothetical protein CC86DRAFT_453 [Ophiobolus disseminans]|uniref:Uncharacterized protein n=1 Tax=Ophiobolus disseminans TaxID=1469910 RepID=A0A6A7AHM9_9PLEO|nr:hypothetical protein CC86DRAFT_453 [Ophiobolus disseminans]
MVPKRPLSPVDHEKAARIRMDSPTEGGTQGDNFQAAQDASITLELCSCCTKLDLAHMFGGESKARDIGFLHRYTSPNCPFCAIIWESIRLHWGPKSPFDDQSLRSRLLVQTKEC